MKSVEESDTSFSLYLALEVRMSVFIVGLVCEEEGNECGGVSKNRSNDDEVCNIGAVAQHAADEVRYHSWHVDL